MRTYGIHGAIPCGRNGNYDGPAIMYFSIIFRILHFGILTVVLLGIIFPLFTNVCKLIHNPKINYDKHCA